MTYTLNASGTASTDPANPTPLWAANTAGTRCFIQNLSIGVLTVLITPTTAGIAPVRHVLKQESFIDDTEMDATAQVSVVANLPGIQFTAWRANA